MVAINKLSDKQLKAINGKPYTGSKMLTDGAGLSVRISPKGKIGWVYRYRLGGRDTNPKWASLGSYPETTLKQAREKRDQCREWLDNGLDPSVEIQLAKDKREKPINVQDALEYWLVEYASEHRKNVEKHRAQFNKHIYPYIGSLPLEQVSTQMWVACFDRIRKGISGKQRAAPVAAGLVFQGCKQSLIFCRKRGFAISHALDDLILSDVGKKQAKRDRVLTEVELRDLLELMQKPKFPLYYRNLLLLLIIFGARTQEVRLSTWNEWDFNSLLWTVPKANSKTDEKIVRPIPESLIPWLLLLKTKTEKTGYVVGGLKSSESVSAYGRVLWKKLKHSEAWTLHDLRRTMATRLNDLGVYPHVADHLLGHTVAGVSGIYNRSQYLPEKIEALEKWLTYLHIREQTFLSL
ncbi:site-specific integrase [Vibrio sp. TH_r3]|uniref:tyrosine-type recombinase/integrase n=1 Tax=Vibrio sp. TH_r3 TaxID=3082084 RepID=UPI002954A51F|nr:site-specific integrase [Vibrio sp. TH_r3]MDV7106138.1 site-specific integrase [Vibrio sp. TH_r3]